MRMKRKNTYDPLKYWNKRGQSYNAGNVDITIPGKNIYDHIVLNHVGSVLDVGCGWGRMYTLLTSLGFSYEYTMCDISDSMIQNCKTLTGRQVDKIVDGILPYRVKFDGIILSYVLQHVPPDSIQKLINEICRVSSRYVYVLDTTAIRERARHCFKHNYEQLFLRKGYSIDIKYFCGGNTFLWIFERNNF